MLGQDEPDLELLVVGDGCTDGTAEVVRRAREEDRRRTGADRVRWFDLPKGPGFGYANRNLALRQARGSWVAFMAHDDLWFSDHLRRMGEALSRPGVRIASSTPMWFVAGEWAMPSSYSLSVRWDEFLGGGINGIPAGCIVHDRTLLVEHGYWDETLPRSGDADLWRRFLQAVGRSGYAEVDVPTCVHFRAGWKGPEVLGVAERAALTQLRQPGLVPPALRFRPRPGQAPQEFVAAALTPAREADVREAVARLRAARLDRLEALDADAYLQSWSWLSLRARQKLLGWLRGPPR